MNVDQDTFITTFPDVSATEIRRARLGMEGVVYYDWKYILEVDFANDDTRVRDAYLQYQDSKLLTRLSISALAISRPPTRSRTSPASCTLMP